MVHAGKQIHLQHHQQPYHQVSLDPPGLICGVMVLAAAVFAVCFRGGPLSLTATAAYYSAGELDGGRQPHVPDLTFRLASYGVKASSDVNHMQLHCESNGAFL
jgi:hypothetical protein